MKFCTSHKSLSQDPTSTVFIPIILSLQSMRHLPRLKLIGELTNYQTLQNLQSDDNLLCNMVVLAGPKLEDALLHKVDHSPCFRQQLNFKSPLKQSLSVPSIHTGRN